VADGLVILETKSQKIILRIGKLVIFAVAQEIVNLLVLMKRIKIHG
jgi:hypothetical protein